VKENASAVLPGDGMGPKITAATLQILRALTAEFQLAREVIEDVVAYQSLTGHGTTVKPEFLEAARRAGRLMLGPAVRLDFDLAREITSSALLPQRARSLRHCNALAPRFDLLVTTIMCGEILTGLRAERSASLGRGPLYRGEESRQSGLAGALASEVARLDRDASGCAGIFRRRGDPRGGRR
jgi:isocitrate/isopropylmalate dehydrogenase